MATKEKGTIGARKKERWKEGKKERKVEGKTAMALIKMLRG